MYGSYDIPVTIQRDEVKTKLLQKIWKVLQNEGIEIPLTQRIVWFANSTPKEEIKMIQQEDYSFL